MLSPPPQNPLLVDTRFRGGKPGGNLIEGLTVFELKDGKLMRIMGIGVGQPGEVAPDGISAITTL